MRYGRVGLAVLFILAGAGMARAQAPARREFVVGLVLPMTGAASENGRSYARGAQAAAAMLNAGKGIGGRTVRLAICDSQSQEQQAVICAKQLTSAEQARVLIGSGSTPQTIAIGPVAASARAPLFAMSGGESPYIPYKPWVFKGLAGNSDQIPPAFDLARQRGWKRMAIVRDNGAYGHDIGEFMLRMARETGMEVVADEIYATTDTDMTAQALRVRDAKPDVVMNYATAVPLGVAVAKKLVQLGVTAPDIVGINLQNPSFVRLAGGIVGQTIFVGPRFLLDQDAAGHGPAQEFAAAYHAMFKQPIQDVLTLGPADAMLLTRAAVAANPAALDDPEQLRLALESLRDVQGVQGRWSFSATDHGPVLGAGITTMVWRDGGWHGP